MSKKSCILVVVVSLFIFSSIALAGGPNMKEGLWEITTKMEIPGMPMQMPPQTYTQCITKKNMVPQKEEPNQECKMIKHDSKGDTVTWVVVCRTPEGKSHMNGRVTYKGTSFDGTVKITQAGMDMTQKMKGRWTGECK